MSERARSRRRQVGAEALENARERSREGEPTKIGSIIDSAAEAEAERLLAAWRGRRGAVEDQSAEPDEEPAAPVTRRDRVAMGAEMLARARTAQEAADTPPAEEAASTDEPEPSVPLHVSDSGRISADPADILASEQGQGAIRQMAGRMEAVGGEEPSEGVPQPGGPSGFWMRDHRGRVSIRGHDELVRAMADFGIGADELKRFNPLLHPRIIEGSNPMRPNGWYYLSEPRDEKGVRTMNQMNHTPGPPPDPAG